MKTLINSFIGGIVLCLVVACGSGTDVTLKVGAIPSSTRARQATRTSTPTDAVQSSTAFAFAKVDGIKLKLTRLQAISSGNEQDIITWSPSREITVAPGSDNTISLTETASVPNGTYRGIKVRYENAYSIKAFCRTSSYFIYTTAAGVTRIPIGSTPSSMPGDYDYYAYPFAEVTTATSASGGNPETMAETDGEFSVASGSAITLALLVDPTYLTSCYDGSTTSSNASSLTPFMWTNNNGVPQTAFFPNASANFGIGYMPIFIWYSTTAGEAMPTAETYASSLTSSDLNSPINFRNVNVTSLAFKADGTLLDSRTRISANGNSAPLLQFMTDYTKNASTYDFYNGEWNCDAGYTNCGVIKDRQITGFARTADFTSTATATFKDGPACGTTVYFPGHESDWGNRARACLGSSTSIYFKQLVR